MSGFASYSSLSKDGKRLPIKYLVASLIKRTGAKNPDHLCDVLSEIRKNSPQPELLRKMPIKSDKYWYRKLDKGGMNMPMIHSIDRYVPGIAASIEDRLWAVLDTDEITANKINLEFYKSKFGDKTYSEKIYQLSQVFPLARHFNIDCFAYLICIARDLISRNRLHILHYVIHTIFRLNIAFSINNPFRSVGYDIYRILYDELYSRERELIEPIYNAPIIEKFNNVGNVTYPIHYQPNDYPHLDKKKFADSIKYINCLINKATHSSEIKDNEINRVRFTYYLLVTYQSKKTDKKLITDTVNKMNADRRGRPDTI